MIVVDTSAMVEALVGLDPDPSLLDALSDELAAPNLLDVEVLSALRGLSLSGKLSAVSADEARRTYLSFTIQRHATAPLADRIWALRHQFTAYDAAYLALAEGLAAPLLTCDAKLDAAGHHATVHVVRPSRR